MNPRRGMRPGKFDDNKEWLLSLSPRIAARAGEIGEGVAKLPDDGGGVERRRGEKDSARYRRLGFLGGLGGRGYKGNSSVMYGT